MKRLVVFSLFSLALLASPVAGAPMSRVVAVIDSRTLLVERGHQQTTVRLAGVDLPPDAEAEAVEYLRREVVARWVLIEPAGKGASYVYRSPDVLSVNRAVMTTWIEGPTLHPGTLLGWSLPGGRQGSELPSAPSAARSTPRAPQRPRRSPRRDNRR